MARGDQIPAPGVVPSSEQELKEKRERASEHLNQTVANVEDLTTRLRQARTEERRARAALAAFYK